VDAIGFGPLAAATRRGLRYGQQKSIAVLVGVDTLGSISAVTKTGNGPVITCTAKPVDGDQLEGPWFEFPKLLLKIVREGGLGAARAELYYDGRTKHETIDLAPELPASTIGAVDLTTIDPTDLDTLTFEALPDGMGVFTTTFASTTDIDSIVDQINESMLTPATALSSDLTAYTPSTINTKTFLATLTVGETVTSISVTFAGVATLANIVTQINAASGIGATLETGDFIQIATDDVGPDVSLVIGAGTANSDLGFTSGQTFTGEEVGTAQIVAGRFLKLSGKTSGSTGSFGIGSGTANDLLGFVDSANVEGVDSTFEPRGAGIVFTFPAGDYVKNTTYEVATTAPQMSIVDFQAAAAALRASGEPFSILHVLHEPLDAIDLLSWQTALEAFRVSLATAEDNPVFFKWVLGGPMAAVGDWNVTDQEVKTTLIGTQEGNKFNTIVHGDIFVEYEEYSGRHRSQLALPYVERMARYPLNINPGLGSAGGLEGCHLEDLEKNRARVESEALVKMQDAGFSVLRDDRKLPFIRSGRTRAPGTSQLTGEQTARAALECARVMRERAFFYANFTPGLGVNGQLSPTEKQLILNAFNDDLATQIVAFGYASSAKAIITGFTSTGGTNKLFVKAVFQRLGQIEDVSITIFVTDDVTIVEGIA
jgi:hypothetical protein